MFANARTSGFANAPVSKGLLFLNGSVSLLNILLGSTATKKVLSSYHWLQVLRHTKIWQGLSSTLYFSNARDLLCGSLLLYAFRIFERRHGSGKYSSYIFASTIIAAGLQLITIYGLKHCGYHLDPLPSGLYGMIFATLVQYFFEIPSIDAVTVIGVPISGKVLSYSIALQMLLGSKESLTAGVCGMIAGLIYKVNIAYVQSWLKLPGFFIRMFSRTFGRLFNGNNESTYSFPMGATLEIQEQQQMEWYEQQMWRRSIVANAAYQRTRARSGQGYSEVMVPPAAGLRDWLWANNDQDSPLTASQSMSNHNDNPQQQPVEEVSEDQVRSLVEMGFNRQDVLHALSVSNNDVNSATSVLLSNSTQF